MVEDDQAAVKTDATIRQLQVVDRVSRQLGLDEVFLVLTPVAKATAERKGRVNFFQRFIPRHQAVEEVPGIAELDVRRNPGFVIGGKNLAARAERTESEKGPRGHKRIACLGRFEESAAQQDNAPFPAKQFHQRFGRMRTLDWLDERTHLNGKRIFA